MTDRRPQPALLGIDVGTSSVKLMLLPVPGPAAPAPTPRTVRVPVRRARGDGRTEEADPRAWWRAVGRAARALDTGGLRVAGIGLSTLYPALVAVDGRGRPLRPAILYNDRRSGPEVADHEASPWGHPGLALLLTGNRVRPGTISLSSLLWLREHEPHTFSAAAAFGHAGSYLGLKLTGRFAMDTTNASLTGLYATASGEAWLKGLVRAGGARPDDVPARLGQMTYAAYIDLLTRRRPGLKERILQDLPPGVDRDELLGRSLDLLESGWIGTLCDGVGVPREKLPEVVSPGARLGGLTEEAAEALGLAPGIPVATGAGDTVCGCLGLGLADASEMAVTCGSTDTLAALQTEATFSPRTVNMTYLDEATWLAVAPMNATGASVDWFVATLLGRGAKRYARFFALAEAAPPGSRGVVFLPYLLGERSPVFDPNAKAVFFGLGPDTGRAEMARAVLEGIAFGHRQILQMMDVRRGTPVERVVASGGGTRHPLARQVRADAADRPYLYADVTDTSALGAALLGGVAAGLYATWREAAEAARRVQTLTRVEPDPGGWHPLKRNFEIFASLYDALKHCFQV